MIPMDFVNKMRKEHKLIMGIGHRVKSVSSVCVSTGDRSLTFNPATRYSDRVVNHHNIWGYNIMNS